MNDELHRFLKTTYAFRSIDRDIFYPVTARPENDAEHTCQLALMAWYIIEKDNLPLDTEKVFMLCLAHDLVEVHAGDVPLWGKDGHEEKAERERQAIETLAGEFPHNPGIIAAIREYKSKESAEAKFVSGLDKLLPFMNQLNTAGIVWKNHGIKLPQVIEILERQAQISPYLQNYFTDYLQFLKDNETTYFN